MSAIGTSLAGAAVFAIAAIWLSLQGWLARRSPNFSLFGETMKMLATGVIAVGLCLIAASVAVTAGLGSGPLSILALMIIPATFIIIWRSVDMASRSLDGDRTGGVALARRVIDLGHQQNLRTA
jgi:phosphatidylglycerophosphate synthase